MLDLPLSPGMSHLEGGIKGVQPGMAYELFRSEGPLAILPLGEGVFRWFGVPPGANASGAQTLPPAISG